MKKILILMLALAALAASQTLTGIPASGISLTGTPDDPVLTNHSGKSIIEVVTVQKGSDGLDYINRGFMAIRPENVIADGGSRAVLRSQKGIKVNGGQKMKSAVVDLVVFSDGQMVGPDAHVSQPNVEARLQAMVAAGKSSFQQLQTAANSDVSSDATERYKQTVARRVMHEQNNPGGSAAAAQKLAAHYASLPTKLWR